jgi:hypothetical protein
MMDALHDHYTHILLWGFIATCAMALIQEGTQAFGYSRMSFPFLIGTFFTGNRRKAQWIGFLCYLLGGIGFTAGYYVVFSFLGQAGWVGALLGLFQGLFMLLVVMPLLPCIHPRMVSPYDGPESARRIEPPGFMALHYGFQTPLIHLIGQMAFGLILGETYFL